MNVSLFRLVQRRPRILVIGGGGHGRVVAEAAYLSNQFSQVVVVDPKQAPTWSLNNCKCVADENEIGAHNMSWGIVVAIGDNNTRSAIGEKYASRGYTAQSVIHPSATVSDNAHIKPGAMILAQSVVGPLAKIGSGAIVNNGAIVEHDCRVADFSHLGPGAVLCGHATLGKQSFLGANSCVKHGVSVADNIVVGHGSVVNEGLVAPGTYVGNPIRMLE